MHEFAVQIFSNDSGLDKLALGARITFCLEERWRPPTVSYLSHRPIAFCLSLSYLNAGSQKTTVNLHTTRTIERMLLVQSHSVLVAALEER